MADDALQPQEPAGNRPGLAVLACTGRPSARRSRADGGSFASLGMASQADQEVVAPPGIRVIDPVASAPSRSAVFALGGYGYGVDTVDATVVTPSWGRRLGPPART